MALVETKPSTSHGVHDGHWEMVAADQLVPGHLITVNRGDPLRGAEGSGSDAAMVRSVSADPSASARR